MTRSAKLSEPSTSKFEVYFLPFTKDSNGDFSIDSSPSPKVKQFDPTNGNPPGKAMPMALRVWWTGSTYPRADIIFHDDSTEQSWYFRFRDNNMKVMKLFQDKFKYLGAVFSQTGMSFTSNFDDGSYPPNLAYLAGYAEDFTCDDGSSKPNGSGKKVPAFSPFSDESSAEHTLED